MELIILSLFILGTFVGSFLGVLVDRLPRKRQVLSGRSSCEFCHKELKWYELIPVISFLLQYGKCRNCKRKLSFFYPTIEISTGFLYAITALWLSADLLLTHDLLFYLFIVSALIVIFFMDLKYRIISNKIIFVSVLATLLWLVTDNTNAAVYNLITGFCASLFLIIIASFYYLLRKKESMGGGDIKMAFLMGLLLGFPDIITAFYIAFLTGAFYSLILILWGKLKLKDAIPFGPFLVLGTLITLFIGEQILSFTLPFLGL